MVMRNSPGRVLLSRCSLRCPPLPLPVRNVFLCSEVSFYLVFFSRFFFLLSLQVLCGVFSFDFFSPCFCILVWVVYLFIFLLSISRC